MIDPPPPAELAYLSDAIGAEAVLALIEARGGTRVYVPRHAEEDGALVAIIGEAAVTALAREYGGLSIHISSAKRWRALVYRGRQMSFAQIALKLGVGERTVWKYVSEDLGRRANTGAAPNRSAAPIHRQTEMPV